MGETNNNTTNNEVVSNKDQMIESGKKILNSAKETGLKATEAAKNFSNKSFGKVKGSYILVAIVVLVVLVLGFAIKNIGNSKDVAYPAVYVNDDGDLMLFPTNVKKEDKAIKLTGDGYTSSVVYANTTDRYVLFRKDSNLYLYDSKKKDETTKLLNDVESYSFTEDDKYVVAVDSDNTLYSYNFGKDKEKLDSDIEDIEDIGTKYVLYSKDDALYFKSLKGSKAEKIKVLEDDNGFGGASFSDDEKKILYINGDQELYVYNISKKESTKIIADVYTYYANETGTKMYVMVLDGSQKDIYYYNGKDKQKIASDVDSIEDYDVDKQMILYSTKEDGEYTLYYQKGNKDAVKVEDGLDSIRSVRLFNGKDIYYINSDNELRYAKINGAKIGKVSTIAEDVEGTLSTYKNGYAFVGDVDKKSNGTLYLATNGKAKKIDTEVNNAYLDVSNDGSKIYYLKDYSSSAGDLYVTSGGKGKKIESDVYGYRYVKDDLIYILKDYSSSKGRGDLYRYTGKSVKLAEKVKTIASTPNYFKLNK